MIPFTLINDLRKANFPHDWSKFDALHPKLLADDWQNCWEKYTPSLEKVIEGCGEDFGALYRDKARIKPHWIARGEENETDGNTPLEAVIRLWLALNP